MCEYCCNLDGKNKDKIILASWSGNRYTVSIQKAYPSAFGQVYDNEAKQVCLVAKDRDNYSAIPINRCPWCGERVDLPAVDKLVKATIKDSYDGKIKELIGRIVDNGNYRRFYVEDSGTDKYVDDIVSWEYLPNIEGKEQK